MQTKRLKRRNISNVFSLWCGSFIFIPFDNSWRLFFRYFCYNQYLVKHSKMSMHLPLYHKYIRVRFTFGNNGWIHGNTKRSKTKNEDEVSKQWEWMRSTVQRRMKKKEWQQQQHEQNDMNIAEHQLFPLTLRWDGTQTYKFRSNVN